ncbi:MAG: ADP-ribosylglycohydrolase family protein [Bdellovibrionales bacterium]|nr:ADP-ribosylglycohydrolase family protein [Bdellovibrionales bacterium]
MKKLDRATGALLGLAIGDALGTTGEFQRPGEFPEISEVAGGGVFRLEPGMWTDDTSMALCLADSLLEVRDFDPIDQLEKYVSWLRSGYRSSTGVAFDIGSITRRALTTFLGESCPFPGPSGEHDAGNGSIMRLAPIPIFYASDTDYRKKVLEFSALSSRTTHGAPACVEACQFMGLWIADAIRGQSKAQLFASVDEFVQLIELNNQRPLNPDLGAVLSGRYTAVGAEIISSGYVVHTLEVALWALRSTDDFRTGMLKVVNLGGDSDTAGAVFGQLAGAVYGLAKIPSTWNKAVHLSGEIQDLASQLLFAKLKAKDETILLKGVKSE